MLGFLSAPMGVAYHIVVALSLFLNPLGSGLATAAAIVAFTVGVRLLLSPLSYHAFRGQARLSALQPKITELRKRYRNQPDKLQQEMTALYRVEGGGMLAGCLPLLLQLPFFSIMYRLFLSATVAGRPNSLLTRDLLSTPLGTHWLTGPGPASTQGLLFLGLFALLAGVAFVAARVSKTTDTGLAPAGPSGQPAGLGLVSRMLPYSTVVIAAFVPLAAGIYLLTTTAWTAAERALLRRWSKPPAR
ncbi:MAG TPA: membrane protein insertase YidC [Streptosporangiaceae bacterium]|nr:membrane protein insertase YidC [Streptosporangiaceae bacterium]